MHDSIIPAENNVVTEFLSRLREPQCETYFDGETRS